MGYLNSIAIIEAQKTMVELSIADHPHQKPKDRKKLHNYLKRISTNGIKRKVTFGSVLESIKKGILSG